MPSAQIEAVLDLVERAHRDRYAQDSSQLAPFIVLFDEQGDLGGYVGLPMNEDREATVLTILGAVVTAQAHGYVFSSEAWMAFTSKEKMSSDDFVMPRNDPERQEVLIMEANSFADTGMRVYDIIRDKEGAVADLRRRDLDGMRMHSRFDIFPRPQHAV